MRILKYLVILVVILVLARNIIIKVAVEGITKQAMGLTLSTERFNIGLTKSVIDIADLKLSNPASFTDPTMLNMPLVYVDYDIGDLFKGKVHLKYLKLYLSDFFVIKDENGQFNLNALKLATDKQEKAAVKKESAKSLPLKIDILDLKIGKVIYKDYSKGREPEVKEFNVGIKERYKNITDIDSFGKLLVVRALTNTTIAELAGFDIDSLKDGLNSVLESVSKLTSNVTKDALKVGKDTGTKAADTVETTVKKTLEEIKDILPFSSDKIEK